MSTLLPQELHRIHQANRAAWNEAAARYEDELDRELPFCAPAAKPFTNRNGRFCTILARDAPVRSICNARAAYTPCRCGTTGLADAGLRVQRLDEHPQPYWNQFPQLAADMVPRLPHTYSLRMRKDGGTAQRQ